VERGELRLTSLTTYSSHILRYVVPYLRVPLDDVRPSDLENWKHELVTSYSARTARSAWAIGLMALRDGWAEYGLPDPTARVKGPPGPDDEPGRALSPEELKLVLEAAETMGARRYAGIVTLVLGGLRRKELAHQLRADLDLDGGWLVVSAPKGKKRRRVPLAGVVVGALKSWLKEAPESDYVWPHARRSGPMPAVGVNRWVADCAKLAGIAHASPHDLRRTWMTMLERAQVDRVAIQVMGGHEVGNNRQTDHYVRPSDGDLRSALKVLEGGLAGGAKADPASSDAVVDEVEEEEAI
ncbi:MAG: tyrosine-type recombinase/integrase, partial [Myxococcota bacterium]